MRQPLLLNKQDVIKLASYLETLQFGEPLKISLAAAKTQLENDTLTAKDYLKLDDLQDTMDFIQKRNCHYIPGILKIWYTQPHTFSNKEEFILRFSAIALLIGAILSHDVFILLFQGKPDFETTGNAFMDICSGGLMKRITQTCTDLSDGITAVFDLNGKTNPEALAAYTGVVDTFNGPLPGNTLKTIRSWVVSPTAFRDAFTCRRINDAVEVVGHAFQGSLSDGLTKAIQAFPILSTRFVGNATVAIALPLYLTFTVCEIMRNGGYAMIDYPTPQSGHFDGFANFAQRFGNNAEAFAGAWGGIMCATLLATLLLRYDWAMSKWQKSAPERKTFSTVNAACTLYRKLAPKIEEIQSTATQVAPRTP